MRTFVIGLALALTLIGTAGCEARSQDKPVSASSATYTMLDDDGHQLRQAFNQAKGSVRLVLLVDPTCAVCLRGMVDVNADLLAVTADPRLQTFIVFEPVIGGKASDIAPAASLLSNAHLHLFWNAGGGFGRLYVTAVDLRRHGKLVNAWDVWTVYGPDATWEGAALPRPALLMHQLPMLDNPDYRYLDGKVFAQTARAMLAKLPAQSAAP
ncbi:MAG: hypothetical protein ABIY40_02195 [Rhodanobacteraceae bacterium]